MALAAAAAMAVCSVAFSELGGAGDVRGGARPRQVAPCWSGWVELPTAGGDKEVALDASSLILQARVDEWLSCRELPFQVVHRYVCTARANPYRWTREVVADTVSPDLRCDPYGMIGFRQPGAVRDGNTVTSTFGAAPRPLR